MFTSVSPFDLSTLKALGAPGIVQTGAAANVLGLILMSSWMPAAYRTA